MLVVARLLRWTERVDIEAGSCGSLKCTITTRGSIKWNGVGLIERNGTDHLSYHNLSPV